MREKGECMGEKCPLKKNNSSLMQPFPLNLKRRASELRRAETREFFFLKKKGEKKHPSSAFSPPPSSSSYILPLFFFRLFEEKQEHLSEK